MSSRINRYFFSLIELMIVLAIVLIISSVIGIKITQAIADHEYICSSSQVSQKLKFAKQLALVNQSDVYLTLFQQKEKIICTIGFAGGSLQAGDSKFRHVFPNIFFSFEQDGGPLLDKSISIAFASGGDIYPKGILYLSPARGSKNLVTKTIDFKEYFSRELEKKN